MECVREIKGKLLFNAKGKLRTSNFGKPKKNLGQKTNKSQ